MTNREIDCLVMGFALGVPAGAWIGYRISAGVASWRERRAARHTQQARRVLRDQAIPLRKRTREVGADQGAARDRVRIPLRHIPMNPPPTEYAIPPGWTDGAPDSDREQAAGAAQQDYEDVVEALTNAGFKRSLAMKAAKACTLTERVDVPTWTQSALRRATNGGAS